MLLFFSQVFFSLFNLDIWVLGDSIPYWAGVRARQTGKENLNTQAMIGWWGIRGLKWADFRRSVECAVLLNQPPKIVFIHLGVNDFGYTPLHKIRNMIKREIAYFSNGLPNSVLIWVDILQRVRWGGVSTNSKIEAVRKRINRWGTLQVCRHSKHDKLILDIDSRTPGFYIPDGVHLSDVGLAVYLDGIRDKILMYL